MFMQYRAVAAMCTQHRAVPAMSTQHRAVPAMGTQHLPSSVIWVLFVMCLAVDLLVLLAVEIFIA
jgi:hypothetical protein